MGAASSSSSSSSVARAPPVCATKHVVVKWTIGGVAYKGALDLSTAETTKLTCTDLLWEIRDSYSGQPPGRLVLDVHLALNLTSAQGENFARFVGCISHVGAQTGRVIEFVIHPPCTCPGYGRIKDACLAFCTAMGIDVKWTVVSPPNPARVTDAPGAPPRPGDDADDDDTPGNVAPARRAIQRADHTNPLERAAVYERGSILANTTRINRPVQKGMKIEEAREEYDELVREGKLTDRELYSAAVRLANTVMETNDAYTAITCTADVARRHYYFDAYGYFFVIGRDEAVEIRAYIEKNGGVCLFRKMPHENGVGGAIQLISGLATDMYRIITSDQTPLGGLVVHVWISDESDRKSVMMVLVCSCFVRDIRSEDRSTHPAASVEELASIVTNAMTKKGIDPITYKIEIKRSTNVKNGDVSGNFKEGIESAINKHFKE